MQKFMMRPLVPVLFLLYFLSTGLSASVKEIPEFREILESVCPNTDTNKYYTVLLPIVQSLKNPESWQATTRAVMHKACSLEMPDWRVRVVFSLGHYGLENGLRSNTVTHLTAILANDSIGKEEYLKTGRLWEHMSETGMSEAEQAELIQVGRRKNLRAIQLEGFALIYVHLRKEGLNHSDAMEKVAEVLPLLQKAHRADHIQKIVREKIFPEEKPDTTKNKAVNEQELWHLFKNSISSLSPDYRGIRIVKLAQHNNKSKWDIERLNQFVSEWLATPYRYGGFSKAGIDCSGFVIKVATDQFPDTELPRSARDIAILGKEVTVEELQTGDLVFFAASKVPGLITHVGIYLSDGQFAHASTKRGITISRLSETYYAKRYVLARRLF